MRRHPFVSVQIVMGLMFLQATQIYRRHSIMRQDDRTNQQDDRPSGQHDMTNRQDNRTSRQGDLENGNHLFMLITQDHPPKTICSSRNLILKN